MRSPRAPRSCRSRRPDAGGNLRPKVAPRRRCARSSARTAPAGVIPSGKCFCPSRTPERDGNHEGHGTPPPFRAVGLLPAAAARGLGIDGASCGKALHRVEPLTQAPGLAAGTMDCTEPAGRGRGKRPPCAVQWKAGQGSPSRGVVTCAGPRQVLAGCVITRVVTTGSRPRSDDAIERGDRRPPPGAGRTATVAVRGCWLSAGQRRRRRAVGAPPWRRLPQSPGSPTKTSRPCGHRLAGDQTGLGALASKGDA